MPAASMISPIIESLIIALIAYHIINRILFKALRKLFYFVLFLLVLICENIA